MNSFSQRAAQQMYLVQRITIRRRAFCNSYARYEAKKQEWLAKTPHASPDEYQRAMTSIAQEVGF